MSLPHASRTRLQVALAFGSLLALAFLASFSPAVSLNHDPPTREDTGIGNPPGDPSAPLATPSHEGPDGTSGGASGPPGDGSSGPSAAPIGNEESTRSPPPEERDGASGFELEASAAFEASGTVSEAI